MTFPEFPPHEKRGKIPARLSPADVKILYVWAHQADPDALIKRLTAQEIEDFEYIVDQTKISDLYRAGYEAFYNGIQILEQQNFNGNGEHANGNGDPNVKSPHHLGMSLLKKSPALVIKGALNFLTEKNFSDLAPEFHRKIIVLGGRYSVLQERRQIASHKKQKTGER